MARPRTPSKILDLRGAFKDHPERRRHNEPEPSAAFNPVPPKHLTRGQKASWREVVKLVPAGVLGNADRVHMEIIAVLLDEFRHGPSIMETSRITRLTSEMGKVGLNPSARASLSIEKPKTNKYAD